MRKVKIAGWTGFKPYERGDPSEECNCMSLQVCPCSRRRTCEKEQCCDELDPSMGGQDAEDRLMVKLGVRAKRLALSGYNISDEQRVRGEKLIYKYLMEGFKRCRPVKVVVEGRKIKQQR